MYVWLIEALSRHAAVVAYDRSGLGRSSPSDRIPDGEARARELHDLVVAMNLRGPIILIGHSIAGLYLRIYARQFPNDVLGLVFVEATHPSVWQLIRSRTPAGDRLRTFLALWSSRLRIRRLPFPLRHASKPPWSSLPLAARREIEQLSHDPSLTATECAELAALPDASRQATSCGDLRDTPLLVISGGTRTRGELRHVSDPETFMETWMALQRELASLSSRGIHRVIGGAGHCDLVTDRRYADVLCAQILTFSQSLRTADS